MNDSIIKISKSPNYVNCRRLIFVLLIVWWACKVWAGWNGVVRVFYSLCFISLNTTFVEKNSASGKGDDYMLYISLKVVMDFIYSYNFDYKVLKFPTKKFTTSWVYSKEAFFNPLALRTAKLHSEKQNAIEFWRFWVQQG